MRAASTNSTTDVPGTLLQGLYRPCASRDGVGALALADMFAAGAGIR